MKNSSKLLLTLAATGVFSLGTASAVTVNSANFVQGWGATLKTNPATNDWTQSETTGINTPQIQGDFTFTSTVTGSRASSPGPVFPNGVLGNGDTGSVAGYSDTFGLSMTATYNGVIPLGATNVRLTLNLISLSIYGVNAFGGDTVMRFRESTAGQTSTSDPVSVQTVAYSTNSTGDGVTPAANFTFLDWNPADFDVAGTSSTRTFNINGQSGFLAIDGLIMEGNTVLTYDPVPEPSSIVLLASGLLVAVASRKKLRGLLKSA